MKYVKNNEIIGFNELISMYLSSDKFIKSKVLKLLKNLLVFYDIGIKNNIVEVFSKNFDIVLHHLDVNDIKNTDLEKILELSLEEP